MYAPLTMTLPHPTPEDISARVQQFLLANGAVYASRATEENWKHAAVALTMPPHPLLRMGTWIVLPWLIPTPEQLDAWLTQTSEAPLRPQVVVICLDVPTIRRKTLEDLAAQHRVELVAISAVDRECYGSPQSAILQVIFDPHADAALAGTNPLEHLQGLGDPRNPEVFFERLNRLAPQTSVTSWLIRCNLAVFALALLVSFSRGMDLLHALLVGFGEDTLLLLGANQGELTIHHGQAWRLLTCMFLHANVLHIAMNLYVLRSLGGMAERLFGPLQFLGLYLLSGLGGSILSITWIVQQYHVLTIPSVGASGAVFGVMGGLLGFALARRNSVPLQVYRGLMRSALLFTVVNLGLGLAIAGIDNGAHVGGLVTGFLAGLLLSRDLPPAPQPSRARVGWTIAGLAGLLALAFEGLAMWVG